MIFRMDVSCKTCWGVCAAPNGSGQLLHLCQVWFAHAFKIRMICNGVISFQRLAPHDLHSAYALSIFIYLLNYIIFLWIPIMVNRFIGNKAFSWKFLTVCLDRVNIVFRAVFIYHASWPAEVKLRFWGTFIKLKGTFSSKKALFSAKGQLFPSKGHFFKQEGTFSKRKGTFCKKKCTLTV